jgi:putative spermidine/putrescine transport system substrate-binding protein
MKLKTIVLSILLILNIFVISACSEKSLNIENTAFENWSQVEASGKNQTVTILMWGGNEMINTYMDNTVSAALKEKYNITLKRVPMNPPEYLNKLINEKSAGQTTGTADIIWINAENFSTAKQGNLLWGPFDYLLPQLNEVYDMNAGDITMDTGIAIEGKEAIWGRAQLIITTDSERVSDPPKSYEELLLWAKENPGRFTYPKLPDDFVGSVFVRSALYELTGQDDFSFDMTEEEFREKAKPVIDYFKELKPYLWREGTAYPASQVQLDELFRNNEVDFTMGFELGKTAGLVNSGAYPSTAYGYVFDTGTIGNAHYLAIPFNSPNKASALLTIDLLQSPEFQLEKFKPDVWGDMPAFDTTKLTMEEKDQLAEIEKTVFPTSLGELYTKRLPELKAQYINWMETMWLESMVN